jgi:ribose transport system substrate-binding protein
MFQPSSAHGFKEDVLDMCGHRARRHSIAILAALLILLVVGSLISACGEATSEPETTAATAAPSSSETTTTETVSEWPAYEGPDTPYLSDGNLPMPATKPELKFKLGFLNGGALRNVLMAEEYGAKSMVTELGGEFVSMDSNLDPALQVSQLEQMIAMKVDVIVAHCITDSSLTQGIAAAQAAGIPVVQISSPGSTEKPIDPNAAGSVSFAYDYAAYETVKTIAEWNPQAKVAVIGYTKPNDIISWINARNEYWVEPFGLTLLGRVDATDSMEGSAAAAQAIIGKYPDVNVIIAYNDYSAASALGALKAAGRTDVKIATSMGGAAISVAGLKDGDIVAACNTPWFRAGELSALMGYYVLADQLPSDFPTRLVLTGPIATPANVDSMEFVE